MTNNYCNWSTGLVACLFLVLSNMSLACSSEKHRQFDFWLGEWTVTQTNGTLAGTNHIRLNENGCVLHEHYRTPTGYEGESLNIYDQSRDVWHQTWVDNQGTLLLIEGGWRDGAMVMEGQGFVAPGKSALNRITWTPNPDGTVRQHWQYQDEKQQWITMFDGLYKKTPSKP
mgnify:CR=1 FL=1